jgi:diaminohydroxyphosphoribosylaminopyrimidine deaminase/5-amino-6-(5-phosphoribosylamino)uracil reductase
LTSADRKDTTVEKAQAEAFMRRALALAGRGMGHTSPNPMVGCVVVQNGAVVAEGYHERVGGYHAERNALTRCDKDLTGADLYVTLEPCCHYGKTPPCTEIIIERGIGRVFVGSLDVNPKVAGRGVKILEAAGIEVITGILEAECRKRNEVFYHYMTTQTPFVVSKYAMTLDGKIACASGDAKWVSGEASRLQVQRMRKQYSGIMVGIGTVLADDPMLNCRIEAGVDPVRIVCDSNLHIPLDSRIVQTAGDIPAVVACTQTAAASAKATALQAAGVTVLPAGGGARVDLNVLMRLLGRREIDSVLLEGGATLNAAAFEAGVVNKVVAFIAPKLVGGAEAPSPVGGAGIPRMADAIALTSVTTGRCGDDLWVSGYPVKHQQI